MKIGSSTPSPVDAASVKSEPKRVDRSQHASSGQASDVRLSDLSTQLASIERSLASSDAFDTKRVETIKQAISDGKFQVNAGAVADKVLSSARELLGK